MFLGKSFRRHCVSSFRFATRDTSHVLIGLLIGFWVQHRTQLLRGLLQANMGTLASRTDRWTICGCEGTSKFLGGGLLEAEIAKVPFRVMVTCTDALPTNVSVAAWEQKRWKDKNAAECGSASAGTATLFHFCSHHQAQLCKKPLLLRLPGVATGQACSGKGAPHYSTRSCSTLLYTLLNS